MEGSYEATEMRCRRLKDGEAENRDDGHPAGGIHVLLLTQATWILPSTAVRRARDVPTASPSGVAAVRGERPTLIPVCGGIPPMS